MPQTPSQRQPRPRSDRGPSARRCDVRDARDSGGDMATAKSLKQKIKDGDIVVALRPSITISASDFEKALTRGSYDLVYIDGQHTPFSDDQLVAISAIAEEAGLPVQFRIPHTRNTYLIGRYLDMGLSGILVPEVEEPGPAQEAVDYAYYAPVGKRSWGGAARFGQVQNEIGR